MAATLASGVHQRVAGEVIARKYRLERQLGEGSQGAVWQAQNLALDLPVALKLVHHLGEGDGVPQRLFREARSAAMLGHPAIVRVFDFGETAEGLPFLAMELLTGESLADYLARVEAIRPEFALRLLLPIADALAAAHARGIVHRDVKPDNIFLSSSGQLMQPKLLDFGIATLAEGSALPRLTRTGAVLGTPNYLPPEQARGLQEVDPRADIWSLCATLYECVTGVTPFHATSWIDVLKRILEDDPAPIARYGIEDAKLWQLLRQGLAKDPADRWPDALAFGRAAASWLLERGVSCDICGVSVDARWLRPEVHTWQTGRSTAENAARPRPAPDLPGPGADSAKPIPLTRALSPTRANAEHAARADAEAPRSSRGAGSLDASAPLRVLGRRVRGPRRVLGGFSALVLFAGSAIGINQLDTSFGSEAASETAQQGAAQQAPTQQTPAQQAPTQPHVLQRRRLALESESKLAAPAVTREGSAAATAERTQSAAAQRGSSSTAMADGARPEAPPPPEGKPDSPSTKVASPARPTPVQRPASRQRKPKARAAPPAKSELDPHPTSKAPRSAPGSADDGLDLMEPY